MPLCAVEWQAELKGSTKENQEKKQKGSDKAGFKSGTLPRSGKVRLCCQPRVCTAPKLAGPT